MVKHKTRKYRLLVTLSGIVGLVAVAMGLFFLFRKPEYSQAYIENGNIFVADSNLRYVKQITFDAKTSVNGKYYAVPRVGPDSELLYVECEQIVDLSSVTECSLKRHDLESATSSTITDLGTYATLKINSFFLTRDGKLFFSTFRELYMSKDNDVTTLLVWDVLNQGIGGQFCDGITATTESEYFLFCASSAVVTSIQGNLYLFDSNGDLIETFIPEKHTLQEMRLGLISPSIEDGKLSFEDTSINAIRSYKISDLIKW